MSISPSILGDFYRKSFNGEKVRGAKKSVQAEENEFIELRRKVAFLESLYISLSSNSIVPSTTKLTNEERGEQEQIQADKAKLPNNLLSEWNTQRKVLIALSHIKNDPEKLNDEPGTYLEYLVSKYSIKQAGELNVSMARAYELVKLFDIENDIQIDQIGSTLDQAFEKLTQATIESLRVNCSILPEVPSGTTPIQFFKCIEQLLEVDVPFYSKLSDKLSCSQKDCLKKIGRFLFQNWFTRKNPARCLTQLEIDGQSGNFEMTKKKLQSLKNVEGTTLFLKWREAVKHKNSFGMLQLGVSQYAQTSCAFLTNIQKRLDNDLCPYPLTNLAIKSLSDIHTLENSVQQLQSLAKVIDLDKSQPLRSSISFFSDKKKKRAATEDLAKWKQLFAEWQTLHEECGMQEGESKKTYSEIYDEVMVNFAEGTNEQIATLLENCKNNKFVQMHMLSHEIVDKSERSPIGLAFSGGGIRSATFNLGLAQGLSKLGILPWVDYLSSISGGGYAAATLISLTSKRSEFGPHWKNFPFNPDIKVFDWEGDEEEGGKIIPSKEVGPNIQLRHMRNYGNFIIPRLGTATADTIGLIGNTLPSFLYTLILFLLAIFSLSTLHYGVTALLAPSILEDKTFVSVQSTPAAPTVAEPSADKQTTQETAASEPTTAPIDVTLYEQGELTIIARGVETTTIDGEALGLPLLERSGVAYFAQKAKTGASFFELIRSSMAIESTENVENNILNWVPIRLQLFIKNNILNWVPIQLQLFIIGMLLAQAGSVFVLVPFYLALYVPEFTDEPPPKHELGSFMAYYVWWLRRCIYPISDKSSKKPVNLTREYAQVMQIRKWTVGVAIIAMMVVIFVYRQWLLPSQERDNIYVIWFPLILTLGASAGLFFFRLFPLPYRPSKEIWSKASFRALFASLQGLNFYAILIIITLTILILPQFYDDQSPKLLDDLGFTFPTTAGLLTLLGNLLLNYTARQEQKSSQGSESGKIETWLQRLITISFNIQVVILSILVLALNLSLLFLFQSRLDDNLKLIVDFPVLLIFAFTGGTALYILCSNKGLFKRFQHSWSIGVPIVGVSISIAISYGIFYLLNILLLLLNSYPRSCACIVSLLIGIGCCVHLWRRASNRGKEPSQKSAPWIFLGGTLCLVVILSFFIIYGLLLFINHMRLNPEAAIFFQLGCLSIIWLFILGRVINFNYVSHHYFYRDRMMNAYLATHLGTDPIQDARYDGRLRLAQINPDGSSSPYHLINGAINLTNSADLRFKDRKSQHFLFSKYYCGSEVTGYVKTPYYRDGRTKLSRAIAVSGAAASSSVGYVTFFAQAFITTILNLRLGLWMTNPKNYEDLNSETYRQLAERDFEKRSNWIPYLWNEMRGQISERRDLVNLSDGGHTGDNGSLYPLFQRRCQIIIAGDASRDHGYKFTDLFHVLLQVKADFNIDVDINVDGIRPDENGESAFHCAVGVIQYPKDEYNPAMKGYLLYFKPNMTGKEPSSLKEYRKQYEKGFPHVSTTDLFFNERQFEAYREIGWLSIERTRQDLVDYYERKIEEKKKKLEANKARRRQVLDMLRLLRMGNVNVEQLLAELFSKANSAKELIDLLGQELTELDADDKKSQGDCKSLKDKKEAIKDLGEKNKFDKYLSGFLDDLREATTVPEKEKK